MGKYFATGGAIYGKSLGAIEILRPVDEFDIIVELLFSYNFV